MKVLAVLIGMGWVLSVGSWAESEPAKPEAKRPVSAAEEAAVGKFKTGMSGVKKGFQDYLEKSRDHEAMTHRVPMELTVKLAGVSTEGLPKELAEAFTTFRDAYRKQAEFLKEMPKEDAEALKWMEKKSEEEKFQEESGKLEDAQYQSAQALIRAASAYGAEEEVDLYDVGLIAVENLIQDRWVVILGASKEFPEAKKQAETLAAKLKIPFTMNGMVFDAEGLHYPKDFEDEAFAGSYVARRGNGAMIGEREVEDYVSVEKSDEYEGFAKGLYIVVAKISETEEDANQQVTTLKKVVPDAYAKRTKLYMGCMH